MLTDIIKRDASVQKSIQKVTIKWKTNWKIKTNKTSELRMQISIQCFLFNFQDLKTKTAKNKKQDN